MIAIVTHRLTWFLRLTLVVALAGYMLPTVSFAMHGNIGASFLTSNAPAASMDHPADHAHHAGPTLDEHRGHQSGHHGDQGIQDCCADFCLNLALMASIVDLQQSGMSPVRDPHDDARMPVEPIGLNRPPQSRT